MPIPNTVPLRFSQVLVQGVKHTDGITYTRCLEHMEITDESLGLAKPKAKAAKGPMRPELDAVRVKPGLGLKHQPKRRQGLLTNMFKKKEHVAAAEPETIERGRKLLMMQLLVIPAAELLASLEGEALAPAA